MTETQQQNLTIDEIVLLCKKCCLRGFATTSRTNEDHSRSVWCCGACWLTDERHHCRKLTRPSAAVTAIYIYLFIYNLLLEAHNTTRIAHYKI